MASPAPPDPREIELRLELDPAQAEHLLELPALRTLVSGPASKRRLHSVYYDTHSLDLHRGGIALRVREGEEEGAWVQTLKAAGRESAGLFDRPEIEWRLAGPEPDTSVIAATGLHHASRAETLRASQPLEAMVETDVQRTTLPLRWGDHEIDLAIDVGHTQARDQRVPICEIELELKSGPVVALYDAALALCEHVAMHPSIQSKADRGFALLTGVRSATRQAAKFEHAHDASLEVVMASVMEDCLGQIVANRWVVMASDDAEGVHQLRIGARRLRSALALFKAMLPEQARMELALELRWLASELGAARDLDVVLHERLEPLLERHVVDGGLERLRDEAGAARVEAYRHAREALGSARLGRLLLLLARFLAARGWRDQALSPEAALLFAPAQPTARKLLRKRQKRALGLGDHLGRKSSTELHALRIQLKKLRYACDFLHSLFPERRGKTALKQLRRLQNVLGHLNDDEMAVRWIDHLLARMGDEAGPAHHRAAGFVIGWTAHERAVAFESLERRFERFAKARPFWR
jgi:inorganic triphosphatase YgiF